MAGFRGSATGLPTGGAAPVADPVVTNVAIVAAVTAAAKIRDALRRTYMVRRLEIRCICRQGFTMFG
jgi:hypothetical protein